MLPTRSNDLAAAIWLICSVVLNIFVVSTSVMLMTETQIHLFYFCIWAKECQGKLD
jgi:hypothetical protein